LAIQIFKTATLPRAIESVGAFGVVDATKGIGGGISIAVRSLLLAGLFKAIDFATSAIFDLAVLAYRTA
jgi:hypothetical protein